MRCLAVLGLLAVAAAPAPSPGPAPLNATIPAGPLQAPVRQLLAPYAEVTETTLGAPAWDGTVPGLKAAGTDLVLLTAPQLAAACAAQAVQKIDWDRLVRERFVGAAATDCGLPLGVTALALAWDRDRVPDQPGWADFWDVTRHPGRRGLQRMARGNLEIALLADGVAAGDIYRTLRSSDGVDRAFRKLDQLKPYVEWWDKPAQPAQYLSTGRVLMISAPAPGIAAAADGTGRAPHRLAVNWKGSLAEAVSLAIVQGAAHQDAAMAALVIASDLARQVAFAEATGLGPANRDSVDLLPDELRANSATNPQNLQAGLFIDEGFWAENGARLEARFAQWLAR